MTKKGFVSLGTLAIALTSSLCLSSCGGNKAEQKCRSLPPPLPLKYKLLACPLLL